MNAIPLLVLAGAVLASTMSAGATTAPMSQTPSAPAAF
jgi:hypothetical protein